MMETKVTRVNGRWELRLKTPSMTTPVLWHYSTEQEATAAEKRLNPSSTVVQVELDEFCEHTPAT